jgi:two-component system sensor histidine kinase RegB
LNVFMLSATTITADNLRRLLSLRGISLLAALLMALLAKPVFRIQPDLGVLLTICAVWTVFGIATWLRAHLTEPRQHPVRRYELLLHLATDIILLTVFLAFCGGTANPLTALYLMPVAVAAAVLSPVLALATAGMSIVAYALLWVIAVPITVEDVDAAMQMHLAGMWLTFVLAALLLVGIVARMSAALRDRDRHLAAAREHSLRSERIAALGSLAAGAAHSLGTPLNTLMLLADEIAAGAPAGSDLATDARELRHQVIRCREIVDGVLTEAGVAGAGEVSVPLESWMHQLMQNFRRLRSDCVPVLGIDPGLAQRKLHPEVTLAQTLTDLLDNAADACPDNVALSIEAAGNDQAMFRIVDKGPGFSNQALTRVRRSPWSGKPHGMGLGLYLAQATAERLGGSLECRNLDAGAEVTLRIPLAALT